MSPPTPAVPSPQVTLTGLHGIGEVTEGDDLALLLVGALTSAGEQLTVGDVLVVASKVVSKAEGRRRTAPDREAAIDAETVRVVAERRTDRGTTRVVQSRSGPVLAAAGVDASNVAVGQVLLLPVDPDASARMLRHRLRELTGASIGVLITDTAGRAWRDGQVDLAIGAAGVHPVDDLRGGTDRYGNPLEVTVRAVADELASAADLVKGKLDAVPAALVRGLGSLVTDDDGPGAAALLRGPGGDWFRLGHVEAVRSALGVPPGTRGVPAAPIAPGTVTERLRRAVQVALAGSDPFDSPERPGTPGRRFTVAEPDGSLTAGGPARLSVQVTADGGPVDQVDLIALGAFVQRVAAAAWTEDVDVQVARQPGAALILIAQALTAHPLSAR